LPLIFRINKLRQAQWLTVSFLPGIYEKRLPGMRPVGPARFWMWEWGSRDLGDLELPEEDNGENNDK
jgi:hypothetical protein